MCSYREDRSLDFSRGWLLLGLVVTGVVIGYTWVCDKCESYFNGRLDRLLSRSKPNRSDAVNPRAAVSPRPTEPRVVGDARSTPDAPQPPVLCDRYIQRFAALFRPRTPPRQPRLVHGMDNDLSPFTNVVSRHVPIEKEQDLWT